MTNQREHFRIKFPFSERPFFKDIDSKNIYTVLDISESGMRLIAPENCLIGPKSKFNGFIKFPNQTEAPITGNVIRITDESIVVKFIMGVEYPIIMELQRYLLQKFGNLE